MLTLSSFKIFALAFLKAAEDDVLLDALPIIADASAKIKAAPTEANAVAQAATIPVQLLAVLPELSSELIVLAVTFVAETASKLATGAAADLAVETAVLNASEVATAQVAAVSVSAVPPTFAQSVTSSPKVGG